MAKQSVYVMTGATSGMGLSAARQLLQDPGVMMIVGARNPGTATELKQAATADRLHVLDLDLASLESVSHFAERAVTLLDGAVIDGIGCNAGLQIISGKRMTADGVDETFAVNHLGHFLMVLLLLPYLRQGGRILSTASGTHRPDDKLAKRFGFRGAVFANADAVSKGDMGDTRGMVEQGLDRYATSKLCNILFTRHMAMTNAKEQAVFVAFDPGLMPGTGLARERPAPMRFASTYVMPAMRAFLPGISSYPKSAKAFADILAGRTPSRSGDYLEYTGSAARLSDLAKDTGAARDLYDVSRELVARYLP